MREEDKEKNGITHDANAHTSNSYLSQTIAKLKWDDNIEKGDKDDLLIWNGAENIRKALWRKMKFEQARQPAVFSNGY